MRCTSAYNAIALRSDAPADHLTMMRLTDRLEALWGIQVPDALFIEAGQMYHGSLGFYVGGGVGELRVFPDNTYVLATKWRASSFDDQPKTGEVQLRTIHPSLSGVSEELYVTVIDRGSLATAALLSAAQTMIQAACDETTSEGS